MEQKDEIEERTEESEMKRTKGEERTVQAIDKGVEKVKSRETWRE